MAFFKCKHCGEALDLAQADNGVCKCSVCNMYQTVSLKVESSPNLEMLYGNASHFRKNGEFDLAISVYQQILMVDDEDAEAYFNVALCRYGIEYVKDPRTGNTLPTVNRTQLKAFSDDDDFQMALNYATGAQREIFTKQAELIDEILHGYWQISNNESPFDVFICYKETAEDGETRTEDSAIAQSLYRELTRDGLKVFYARETLKGKLGSEYEPYIFAALNSARFMLVVGTKKAYFNAVWVKNEWSRYLALIAQGNKKTLIPVYRDINAYELPKEFKNLQAQNYAEVGATDNIVLAIENVIKQERPETVVVKETTVEQGSAQSVASLIERAYDSLSYGDFEEAKGFANKAIEIDYKNADAYVVLLLVELEIESLEELSSYSKPIDKLVNFRKSLGNAQGELKDKLKAISDGINQRVAENARIEEEKRLAEQKRIEEEQRLAEQKLIEEEKRLAEEKRLGEEKHLAEERRLAEEAKKKESQSTYAVGKELTLGTYAGEAIQWQVLANEGGKALLISKYALDAIPYNKELEAVTWESCSLRKWLNNDFYNNAFNSNEKGKIQTTYVLNSDNKKYNTRGGSPTNDKVFLLSIDEAEKYFSSNKKRKCIPTSKAKSNGIYVADDGNCRWWIRSPGYNQSYSSYVSNNGGVNTYGNIFDYARYGVRPALWISIEDVQIDTTTTKKESEEILLNSSLNVGGTTVLGAYGGEPIEWEVLANKGCKALLISKYALDAIPYNKKYEDVTWESCSLRKWLNNDFYNNAFNSNEKGKIQTTYVLNPDNRLSNTKGGSPTNDKVFLLSIDEAETYFVSSEERKCKPTSKAKSSGIYVADDGNCWWWLRSPGLDQDYASNVNYNGYVYTDGFSVDDTDNGVRPAIWVSVE